MGNLIFLLIAIALSAIGIFIVWVRHRGPSGVTHGVDSFTAQMRAIAPDHAQQTDTRPTSGPHGPTPRR